MMTIGKTIKKELKIVKYLFFIRQHTATIKTNYFRLLILTVGFDSRVLSSCYMPGGRKRKGTKVVSINISTLVQKRAWSAEQFRD